MNKVKQKKYYIGEWEYWYDHNVKIWRGFIQGKEIVNQRNKIEFLFCLDRYFMRDIETYKDIIWKRDPDYDPE